MSIGWVCLDGGSTNILSPGVLGLACDICEKDEEIGSIWIWVEPIYGPEVAIGWFEGFWRDVDMLVMAMPFDNTCGKFDWRLYYLYETGEEAILHDMLNSST